jgi:hypothetical protein
MAGAAAIVIVIVKRAQCSATFLVNFTCMRGTPEIELACRETWIVRGRGEEGQREMCE